MQDCPLSRCALDPRAPSRPVADPASRLQDEFEIHTPSLSATKWWPGSLGCTANTAIVFARLLIDGKDHGVHNFIVPLRNLDTHQLLPGVTAGDIGPKIGYNNMDNGWCRLGPSHDVRHRLFVWHRTLGSIASSPDSVALGSTE